MEVASGLAMHKSFYGREMPKSFIVALGDTVAGLCLCEQLFELFQDYYGTFLCADGKVRTSCAR